MSAPTRSWIGRRRTAPAEYQGESGFVGTDARPGTRNAALDGIRAIAILLVIAHNAGSVVGGAEGIAMKLWTVVSNAGWIGVQLFFALSGFLITRILLQSKGAEGWLRSFYVRRVLRIVPLYYALLVFVFLIVPHVPFFAPLHNPGTRSGLWFWSYLSNWMAPFGGLAGGIPHVWSLAVEEQFYLVWPFVIAMTTERALVRVCILTFFGALLVRMALHAVFTDAIASEAAYSWTISRADAIVMGGLGAIALRDARATRFLQRHLLQAGAAAAAAMLCILAVNHGLPPHGLLSEMLIQPLAAVLSVILVLGCVIGPVDGRGAGLQMGVVTELSRRWMTTIGKYSYSIYVFHMSIHLLLRPHAVDLLTHGSAGARFAALVGYTALVFFLSLLFAMITWRIIEEPFLSLKRFFPTPSRA
jgi:peptidoglycan/LPS O-acetylase OafA/YrhL